MYGLFALWIDLHHTLNLQNILQEVKKENIAFVQLESFWIQNCTFENISPFKIWAHKKFITPYTALISLSQSEEEILANMKPKGRYNIGLAQKKWVLVYEAEKTSTNIEIFYNLMCETTSRDGFSWNTLEYYTLFLKYISNSKLIFTEFEWNILSAWIFVFDDEISIYYYGASTSKKEYRNFMAPYIMQWFAIKYAKNIWSKYYDFLWIASPNDTTSHLQGVTDFKLKFTKEIVYCSESILYVLQPWKYFFFKILQNIKKYIQKK